MVDTQRMQALQELFSEKQAYVTENRLDGKITVFPETFIRVFREALSTDCMAKMSEAEYKLAMDFIEYQNTGVINDEAVVDLDSWVMNIINCDPNPVINGCYKQEDHTYQDCGV